MFIYILKMYLQPKQRHKEKMESYEFIVFDDLNYKTNEEYRNVVRRIVKMDKGKIDAYPSIKENNVKLCDFEDMDDETIDEMTFDEEAIKKFLDYVYKETCDNFDFQELYELAAAKMISTDNEIGLSVLFSFDYLHVFYIVLCDYMKNKKTFNDKNLNYIKCMSMLK